MAALFWCFHPGTTGDGFVKYCWERRLWQGSIWPGPGSWGVWTPCVLTARRGEPGRVLGLILRHTSFLTGRDVTETALPPAWAVTGVIAAVRRDKPFTYQRSWWGVQTDWFQKDYEQVLRLGACHLPQLKKQVWIYRRHDWSYPRPCSLFSGPSRWLGIW